MLQDFFLASPAPMQGTITLSPEKKNSPRLTPVQQDDRSRAIDKSAFVNGTRSTDTHDNEVFAMKSAFISGEDSKKGKNPLEHDDDDDEFIMRGLDQLRQLIEEDNQKKYKFLRGQNAAAVHKEIPENAADHSFSFWGDLKKVVKDGVDYIRENPHVISAGPGASKKADSPNRTRATRGSFF